MADDQLYQRIAQILEQARGQVARTVNTAMVHAYWHVGREIVQVEQAGEQRAGYGEEVIKRLAARLRGPFGKGFGVANLKRMRQFYRVFPRGSLCGAEDREIGSSPLSQLPAIGSSPSSRSLVDGRFGVSFPPELAWSHYLVLMRVPNEQARAFYEIEAARECWSVRQLEQQIGALLFDRLAKHRQ